VIPIVEEIIIEAIELSTLLIQWLPGPSSGIEIAF
jgi:hypothetical protein